MSWSVGRSATVTDSDGEPASGQSEWEGADCLPGWWVALLVVVRGGR